VNKTTPELRLYIERRYALGRVHAQMVATINDSALGRKYGIGQSTVHKLIRRGFTVSKCNNVEKQIPVEIIEALKVDVRRRKRLEAFAAKNTAHSIGLDIDMPVERVRAIGSLGLIKKAAPKAVKKVHNTRSFLTAPATSFGNRQGYY
jgi:hypothetical protein